MPDKIIESCEECPYSKRYDWEGKSWRCKAPEIVEECERHGKPIEIEDWEDINATDV